MPGYCWFPDDWFPYNPHTLHPTCAPFMPFYLALSALPGSA